MNELLNFTPPPKYLFYLDHTMIKTKTDLNAIFKKYSYVSSYTFSKTVNGIGFLYGRHRSSPKNTYFEPIVSIKNAIPSHIYIKGYYAQGNNTLMYFAISISRGDNIMRLISIYDLDARNMVYEGVYLDEDYTVSSTGTPVQKLKSSETVEYDIDVQTKNFKKFMNNTSGNVFLNIESVTTCLSSTGNSWSALPFYVQKLIIT